MALDTALALLALVGRAFLVAALLFANGSNPVLHACAAYWLRRARPALHWLAAACLVAVWGCVARTARWCIGPVDIDDITLASPLLDRTCSDIIMSHDDLVAYFTARPPPPPPPRLCPNGDHGNVEETLIIVREHLQKITGAVLTALFLSALFTYALQAASSLLPVSLPSLPSDSVATGDRLQADFDADFDAVFGRPRAYYRRPPADPRALAVYKVVPPSPHFMLEPGMNLADARKAMRAARAACLHASAQAYVAAVRSRIEQDNHDADSGFTGGIHADPDRDAEAAIGMALFGLDDGSLIGRQAANEDWLP